MERPDFRLGARPPFDGLRAYLRAVQSRDDLHRIRQLEQRNGGLKQSMAQLPMVRCEPCKAPDRAWWQRVLRADALRPE
ncbi:hypothetical protein [Achromobacter sp.]|uniref:hypothetical protein n=1 Tax=Achromobacter sp. TaxID=134375 RepID=UPI002899C192|nr:hypothetical protein [Achromobacter sp.]